MERFLAVILISILLASCRTPQPAPEVPDNSTVEVAASNVDLARPLVVSTMPDDVAIAKRIDDAIAKSEFANARWGVFAISLKDGRIVAARDAQKLFNPASIHKLLTSVVALDRLGAEFRWQTRVYANGTIADGTLTGDLVLYGGGAPDLDEAALRNLVEQVKAKGIKKIKGNVVGDESFFTGDKLGDGWAWNELQWYYGAEASALSIDRNLTNLKVENNRPRVAPNDGEIEVSGEIASPSEKIESVGVKRELGANKFYVWGEARELDVRVAVENPALWTARRFRKLLADSGITVDGEAKKSDWTTAPKFEPKDDSLIASVESAPLAEIVRGMNKDSVNLYAELILRTLGKKFGAEVPDENPKARLTRGDDAAGAAVVKKWLADHNALGRPDESIKDGSGLSRLDLVTPETIGRAIVAGNQLKDKDAFRLSLPLAGTDGTLRGRLAAANGKIAAKTGSMTFVSSLAGYAKRGDETFAFAIVCNDQTRKSDVTPFIDALALELIK